MVEPDACFSKFFCLCVVVSRRTACGQYFVVDFFAVACNLCDVNAIFEMLMRSLQHHKDRCNIAHKRLNLTKNLYNCPIDCVIPSLVAQSNKDVGNRNARDGLLDVVSDLRERLMGGFGINLLESVELQYLHYLAGMSHDDREIKDVVNASSNTGWHQRNELKGLLTYLHGNELVFLNFSFSLMQPRCCQRDLPSPPSCQHVHLR
jgi:hypothetical protein